jgi:hypothetical protein
MKIKIIALLSLVILTSFSIKPQIVNPTGKYQYGNTKLKNGKIYGYYGEIRVRKFLNDKVIVSFLFSKGAPSYNSGSFIDTLNFNHNKAVYKPDDYGSCEVTFLFSEKGVAVTTNNQKIDCGFGMGVVANGFFKKKSSKQPEIIDLLTGDKY